MEQASDFPIVRRIKAVPSRQLDGDAVRVAPAPTIEIPAAPPAIIDACDAAPAVDPTAHTLRRRKRRHQRLFQGARLAVTASFACTLAMATCLPLGMLVLAQVSAAVAVAGALLGVLLAWPTRLSSRVLGYAVAAMILSLIGLAASLTLPREWFDDRPGLPSVEPAKSHHRAAQGG